MATRGSFVHNSMGKFLGGIPKMLVLFNFLSCMVFTHTKNRAFKVGLHLRFILGLYYFGYFQQRLTYFQNRLVFG